MDVDYPPALLPSTIEQSNATLERFVDSFYHWYFISDILKIYPQWEKSSEQQFEKNKYSYAQQHKKLLLSLLSKDFHHWLTLLNSDPFGYADVEDPRYCSADCNPFLCSQDIGENWETGFQVSLIERYPGNAVFKVAFPSSPYPYFLRFYLKTEAGLWKIDRITALPSH